MARRRRRRPAPITTIPLAERRVSGKRSGRAADRSLAALVSATSPHEGAFGRRVAAMGQRHPHRARISPFPGVCWTRCGPWPSKLKVTPFLIYLTIFARRHGALVGDGGFSAARPGRQAHLPGSVQHGRADVLRRCGGHSCAARRAISKPSCAASMAEYDAALALRIPDPAFLGAALRAARHRGAGLSQPHSGGVQLLFGGHRTREGRERQAEPDATAALPWPPDIVTLSPGLAAPLFAAVPACDGPGP